MSSFDILFSMASIVASGVLLCLVGFDLVRDILLELPDQLSPALRAGLARASLLLLLCFGPAGSLLVTGDILYPAEGPSTRDGDGHHLFRRNLAELHRVKPDQIDP